MNSPLFLRHIETAREGEYERKLKQKWKLKEAWWYAIPTDDNDDDEDEDDDHDDDDL